MGWRFLVVIVIVVAGCAGSSTDFTAQAYEARLHELCDEAAAAIAGEEVDRVDSIADELAGMSGPEFAEDIGAVGADELRNGDPCPALPPFTDLERVYHEGSEPWKARLAELSNRTGA